MSAVESEDELLGCFRRIDRRDVELAPDLRLPLRVDDVFAWSVGPRAFLLFADGAGAQPRGLVFARTAAMSANIMAMCRWCHSVRGQGAIKLMSVSIERGHSVGVYVCSDLGCLGRAREFAAGRGERETLRRIRDFANRCLG
ncbi:MAG TPA: FBP domain-containing protein [Polyangia bacterium]|nr:FBP domain-containing protein [Polyangia bacterium]